MKFEKLVKGRCYEDKLGNVYMFDGYTSPTEAELVVMEYNEEDGCYYSTDMAVFMDRFSVLDLDNFY